MMRFGVGQVGKLARELGGRRVLVVTDAGVVAAGHAGRVVGLLRAAGLEVSSFDAVRENPTSEDVEACRAAVPAGGIDLLVAVGGGSSIDVAKGCNFVLAGGGRMEDYQGVGRARGELLPLIAIPTTAGTGSEVQSFALIGRADTHQKMACGDPQAMPAVALLDPELTLTLPRSVTVCTGLDAIGHAVETAVTRDANEVSLAFSHEAFRLAIEALPRVVEAPGDIAARGAMLRAASHAGLAIEHSMLGAAHSMANPLTAHYGVPHGLAVGFALPVVVRFNSAEVRAAAGYAALAQAAGFAADELPERLEALCGLADRGALALVPPAAAAALAEEAAAQWTAQFNPRPVTAADFEVLYRQMLV